uniref:MFS domain-containing protein n=1 Tax=Panagrellus redivivus TaxID=6233 RepID=A0A7E4UUR9_PANRE
MSPPIHETVPLTSIRQEDSPTPLPLLDELGIENVKFNEDETAVEKQTTDWTSIYVAASLSFVGAVQFSLFFVIVSLYSLGTMLVSPIVGIWANKIHSSVPAIELGLLLMLLGNVLYFATPVLPIPLSKKYLILIARVFVGVGSANMSLLRAYSVTASTGVDRAKAIAYVTGGLALGMTMGPAFQLLFTPLGSPGWVITENLQIDIYTAPAILGCLFNIFGIYLVRFHFVEKQIGVPDKAEKEKHGKLPPYDKLAIAVCYFTWFCQMFIITNLEGYILLLLYKSNECNYSIGTPLAMVMFAWDRSTVVRNVAIAQGIKAALSLITFWVYIQFNLGRRLNSNRTMYACLAGLVFFHLLTYMWPFLPGEITTFNNNDVLLANGTELVGCNTDHLTWCTYTTAVNPWIFYAGYTVVIALTFSHSNIALNTLFSKIIGPRQQAAQQGFLQLAGGSARFLGPVLITYIYVEVGPRWVWNIELAVVIITLASWILLKHRMVPLEVPEAFAQFQDKDDPDRVRNKKQKKSMNV